MIPTQLCTSKLCKCTGQCVFSESPKEKPSALPLNVTNAFQNATNASNVTPQMALLQTMAVMHQKVCPPISTAHLLSLIYNM